MATQNDSAQNLVPVQAFVLAFVLFTTQTLQSILAGILIAWLLLAAFLLKNMLTPLVPAWSRNLSVAVAAAALCWSVFRLTAWSVAKADVPSPFINPVVLAAEGLLIAHTVLFTRRGHGYSCLMVQSAAVWLLLILTGVVREYLSGGSVLGVRFPAPMRSAAFARPMFGLIAAALPLALFDAPAILFPDYKPDRWKTAGSAGPAGLIKRGCAGVVQTVNGCSLPVLVCLLLCPSLGYGNPSLFLWAAGILAVLLFHEAVRRRLAYAPSPVSRLPVLLMATGFFYMILTAY